MKKLFLSFFAMAALATLSFAQDSSPDDWVDNGDFVQTSKKAKAEQTGIAATFILNRTDGKSTSLIAGATGSTFRFDNTGDFKIQAQPKALINDGNFGSIVEVAVFSGSAPANSLVINDAGQIGIGGLAKADISQALTINGTVLAEEAQVVLDVTAPDYVFEEDYDLLTLEEVESYIKTNKHLPEIPSADEFARDGVQLGKMSYDLLKKVEELTLYMIELKKENDALKARVELLEK